MGEVSWTHLLNPIDRCLTAREAEPFPTRASVLDSAANLPTLHEEAGEF
jgi:hypothetical protein